MKVVHTQKFIRTTPRKLREVADIVKSLDPERAVEVLPFTGKRAAFPLQKVLKAALANARDAGVSGQLSISEIQVNEGPRLKRGRAASRGRWQPYKRRMSHVRIVLQSETSSKKSETDKKVSKKEVKQNEEKKNTLKKTSKTKNSKSKK